MWFLPILYACPFPASFEGCLRLFGQLCFGGYFRYQNCRRPDTRARCSATIQELSCRSAKKEFVLCSEVIGVVRRLPVIAVRLLRPWLLVWRYPDRKARIHDVPVLPLFYEYYLWSSVSR